MVGVWGGQVGVAGDRKLLVFLEDIFDRQAYGIPLLKDGGLK